MERGDGEEPEKRPSRWEGGEKRKAEEVEDGEIVADAAAAPSPSGVAASTTPPPGGREGNERKPKRREHKKQLQKKRRKLEQGLGTVEDCYAVYGENAKAEIEMRIKDEGRRIRIRDIQSFLLWTLADASNPNWIFLKNKPLVQKVVVVFASGFCISALDKCPHLVKNVTRMLSGGEGEVTAVKEETKAEEGAVKDEDKKPDATLSAPAAPPSTSAGRSGFFKVDSLALNSGTTPASTVQSLLTIPHRKKRSVSDVPDLFKRPYAAQVKEGKLPYPAGHYTLTLEEMIDNGYPVRREDRPSANGSSQNKPGGAFGDLMRKQQQERAQDLNFDEFKSTGAPAGGGGSSSCEKLVAIDCEMCHTCKGPELTRVTLVDDCCKVLYDKLVKPANEIVNYVTEFSGITADMLESVETTLEDVQREILEMVDASTLIVGHSLENDLLALRLFHANVIDTAILYPHNRGPPLKCSLKWLADKWLNKAIQKERHNPIEDARTAMELVRLKIHFGPNFGTTESEGVSICKTLSDHKKTCSLLDRQLVLRKHAVGSANAILCRTDEDVCQKSLREIKSPSVNLVWTNLADLWDALELETRTGVDAEAILDDQAKMAEERRKEEEGGGGMGAKGALAGHLGGLRETIEAAPLVREALQRMDERIGRIYDAMPRNALLVMVTGQGNTAYVKLLQQIRWRCRNVAKSAGEIWDAKCEDHMNFAMREAAQTICVVGIKD